MKLSLEDILRLPAGTDLDIEICRRVMGWKYAGFVRRQPVYETGYSSIEFRQVEPGIDFCPSTKIQDAWLVIERLGCSKTVLLRMASTGGSNDCSVTITGLGLCFNKNVPKEAKESGVFVRYCERQEEIPFLLCQMALQVEYKEEED